ncbi:MAG TPA: hypothetical protein VF066_15135 [Thermoleophilaceae bacterium]
MSDSYPTIQDALSDVQKEFMGCVETHLDPPDHSDPTYSVEAVYRSDDGTAIRFCVSVDETDPDISERRHTIEFLPGTEGDEPIARVAHSMKRVEAARGRFFWTESEFHVAGPDVPTRRARHSEVEEEVRAYIERVRALDSARKLVEIA